jgi:hypothetical protein
MWIDDEAPNLTCGSCKYFLVNADMDSVQSKCKRIDHKKIKFAVPWFKSYDCGQNAGCICSDYEPAKWCKYTYEHWTNFDDYWKLYVEQWLPYSNTNTTKSFTLHNNTDINYKVPLLDYVYGNMIDGNKLKAIEKEYYKQDRNPKGYGYRLIHEKIDGVEIE